MACVKLRKSWLLRIGSAHSLFKIPRKFSVIKKVYFSTNNFFSINSVYWSRFLKSGNKSWRKHPTKQQLYGHLPPITKTIKISRSRHAVQCWRSRDELISDVLLWTPSHGRAKAGRPARTYVQQLCAYTGCNPEDLPEAMDNREGWRERVWDIRADSATSWWWLQLFVLYRNTWNRCKKTSLGSFRNIINKICLQIYIWYISMKRIWY